MFPARRSNQARTGGFTLIETMVALAVASASLSAIGALMATNVRGSHKVDQHIGVVQALRALDADLQDRSRLTPGIQTGDREGIAWTIEILPYPTAKVVSRKAPVWAPQRIVTNVRSPTGDMLEIETIRLTRGAPQ